MIACLLLAGWVVQRLPGPVIWADVPDPSIVRVGDAYYMSSTTMHMSPGLPIMKSKDLLHWKLVSYAYRTLGSNEALNLENGKNAYGRGSWASSLRWHNGSFYASTFSATTGKTYIFSTKNPNKSDWKETSFSPVFHDHSLFFDDDGRVYLVTGSGDIRLVELKEDLSGPKPNGVNKIIVKDASRVAGPMVGLPAEGSQLFKVNGQYYLCNITWPRGGMRTEIVHRASRIEGPYEGRILFQDQGIAQGGMVDTPDGRWFAYLFQDHGAVGRVPFIIPMTWQDGWPVVGNAGKLPSEIAQAPTADSTAGIVESDEFNRPALSLAWQWNHNPDDSLWSLSARNGWLRLSTGRVDSQVTQARNTLTQRTFGPECSATVRLDVSGLKDGDCAGLMALQNRYAYVGVKAVGSQKSIVMVEKNDAGPVEQESVPLDKDVLYLRMECDFKGRADWVGFEFSLDGRAWRPIGPAHQLRYDLVHFMGCRFGLFNFASKAPGGHADFDYFRVANHLSGPLTH